MNNNNKQMNFNNNPFLNANNPFQLLNNNALIGNSNNFLDYLSQAVSNNILQAFINNNQNQSNYLQFNNNPNQVGNIHSKDIFNYKKKSKKDNKSLNEDKNILFDKEKNIQYQNSTKKRKDNINKFLLNYRLKNMNNNQYNATEKMSKNIDFLNKNRKELVDESELKDKKRKKNNDDKKEKGINFIKSEISGKNEDKEQKNKNIKINNFNNKLLNDDLNSEQDIFSKSNNDNNKEDLKKIFLDEIFNQKIIAKNYEISKEYFKEIEMPPYGNCFYCCLSYFLYKSYNNHMEIRKLIYQYITNNPEEFLKEMIMKS